MLYNALVSIIIPTYNRENLIGETLDSILVQTYHNWECIVVDDGSTDDTLKVLDGYHKISSRINYYQRAANLIKGANTCRNMGLNLAKGDYVVFFDSDDLMTDNHLEVKINGIKKHHLDYVIARTEFFNADNSKINKNYNFSDNDITSTNYITQKINWLTYDVMIKSSLAKSIKFNENLRSGQEYNYFCKLVLSSVNACFIDKVLTLRRKHGRSIRANLKTLKDKRESYFNACWYTYLDIKEKASAEQKKHLLNTCINFMYKEKKQLAKNTNLFSLEVFKTYKMKCVYYIFFLLGLRAGRSYYFRNKLQED